MVRIEDAIVKNGQVTLSRLPFPDGARVTVTVNETTSNKSIDEVRESLRGTVIYHDYDPSEPVIDPSEWDVLK